MEGRPFAPVKAIPSQLVTRGLLRGGGPRGGQDEEPAKSLSARALVRQVLDELRLLTSPGGSRPRLVHLSKTTGFEERKRARQKLRTIRICLVVLAPYGPQLQQ